MPFSHLLVTALPPRAQTKNGESTFRRRQTVAFFEKAEFEGSETLRYVLGHEFPKLLEPFLLHVYHEPQTASIYFHAIVDAIIPPDGEAITEAWHAIDDQTFGQEVRRAAPQLLLMALFHLKVCASPEISRLLPPSTAFSHRLPPPPASSHLLPPSPTFSRLLPPSPPPPTFSRLLPPSPAFSHLLLPPFPASSRLLTPSRPPRPSPALQDESPRIRSRAFDLTCRLTSSFCEGVSSFTCDGRPLPQWRPMYTASLPSPVLLRQHLRALLKAAASQCPSLAYGLVGEALGLLMQTYAICPHLPGSPRIFSDLLPRARPRPSHTFVAYYLPHLP